MSHACLVCGCHPRRRCWDETANETCQIVAGICTACRADDQPDAPEQEPQP